METLLDEVSGAAYDKAVEAVAEKVREQTQLADIATIEKYRKGVTSPGTKNSQQVIKLVNTILNSVKTKLKESAGQVQANLQEPTVRQAGKEQVKEKARESIKDKLARAKEDADRKNRERWERTGRISPTTKQDMEL